MKRPAALFLLPAHNEERYSGQALRSIFNKSCTDWELTVDDDGPTDSNPKTLGKTHRHQVNRVTFLYTLHGAVSSELSRGRSPRPYSSCRLLRQAFSPSTYPEGLLA